MLQGAKTALFAACTVGSTGATAQTFQGIGFLAGGTSSLPFAVTDDGQVVGSCIVPQGKLAVRWTASGGMESLGDFPGGLLESDAADLSEDGAVIVGTGAPPNFATEAFQWTLADGLQGLGDLPGGPLNSFGLGVSADGSVVVGFGLTDNGPQAYRWTAADGMVGLPDLPGGPTTGAATAISADGNVVVGLGTRAAGNEAARWVGGVIEGLGLLPSGGTQSVATAASADGAVVVGNAERNSRLEAFRWTASDGMQSLGTLPGEDSSDALGVSADGTIIVGHSPVITLGDSAFIWDDLNGLRRVSDVLTQLGVDLSGWTLHSATAISPDGRTIIGSGTNPSGQSEGWIATLPATCQADLAPPPDGDGAVNTNDFFQFLAYYQAQDPAADFTGEGAINTNDFFAFLAAYQAGCP